jgi:hypothetical protein
VFPSDFQAIADGIGSTHKQTESVVADHYGNPVVPGEHRRDHAAGLIDQWLQGLD